MTGGHHHHHHRDAFSNHNSTMSTEHTFGSHFSSRSAEDEAKAHKHKKHLAEAGVLAAAAFAHHEKKEAKKHPEDVHRHKIEHSIAKIAAIGAAGVALHERHEEKHAKKEAKKHNHHH